MINRVFKIVIGGLRQRDSGTASEILAKFARVAGIEGFTLSNAVGWHKKWGVEQVTVIETSATTHQVERFINALCVAGKQECAYVTINGATGALWYPDGRKVSIGSESPDSYPYACCGYTSDSSEHSPFCRNHPNFNRSVRTNGLKGYSK